MCSQLDGLNTSASLSPTHEGDLDLLAKYLPLSRIFGQKCAHSMVTAYSMDF